MLEIYEHNKNDCIRLLNMIICEIPFIKSFSDDCLLERLLNLISIITNAFNSANSQSLASSVFDTEDERETAIREWLLRHYSAKSFIDDLDFNDIEDRTRVTVLIINIIYKLRHSLKDIEQYLKDCDSFVQFDQQLSHIMRFDKLLEIVENDCNRWKSEARHYKIKFDESKKLIDKYQRNEIFNYNCNPRNQNLYKSRITTNRQIDELSETESVDKTSDESTDHRLIDGCLQTTESIDSSAKEHINQLISELKNYKQSKCLNMDINYLCIDCNGSYSTKFEYNLHVFKKHRNLVFSPTVSNSNTNSFVTNESTKVAKHCKNINKRVFRCLYYNCGKAFPKTQDLKTHFVKHQPKIDRLLYVYKDYTHFVLNRLRPPTANGFHLSSNYDNMQPIDTINKSIKFNSDMNLNVNNYGFTNGFGIDSHLNHSKMN